MSKFLKFIVHFIVIQNKVKVILNGLWLYVRGNKIAMRLEQKFMEHKYIQRVSPYSERKNR